MALLSTVPCKPVRCANKLIRAHASKRARLGRGAVSMVATFAFKSGTNFLSRWQKQESIPDNSLFLWYIIRPLVLY